MTTDFVIETLRQGLERGGEIVVEGLGTFRKTEKGVVFRAEARPRVFLAYAAEDLERVRRLCESLRNAGLSPWMDRDQLLPGQNWPRSIERAIASSNAFLACFSMHSVVKKGHFQCELRYALDCARRLPLDDVFVIPVRLEKCDVPKKIADETQYVDLFPDWERGVTRIVKAVRERPRIEGSLI